MTDEEKQAIEILKTIKRPTLATGFERQTNLLKAVETVLNLIEKQQAEIEDLGKEYNYWVHKAVTRGIELEKKDKIIDEMANEIIRILYHCNGKVGSYKTPYAQESISKTHENIKEYFKKKVEDR